MAARMASAARHAEMHRDEAESFDDSRADLGEDAAEIGTTGGGGGAVDPDADDDDSGVQGSNVRVVVRIRPLLESELAADHTCSLIHVGGEKIRMDAPQPIPPLGSIQIQSKENVHRFAFDAVLGPQTSQAELFAAGGVDHMLTQLLKGYHGTIFAYGQTGSGKTHTMDGISYSTKQVVVPAGVPVTVDGETGANVKSKMVRVIKEPSVEESGLSLRCINELFAMIAARQNANDYPAPTGSKAPPQMQYTVKCSFIQIYQESVYDLLTDAAPLYVRSERAGSSQQNASSAAGLRIRWSQNKDFYVENLYIFECKSAKEARNYFLNGMKKRLVASHRMNASSSRSHCIFTLYLEQKAPDDRGLGVGDPELIVSKLSLVDLAGSERVALTGATGSILQQSIGINKSLFVLRKVIKSLAKLGSGGSGGANAGPGGKGVVHPYRDSTLTRLLKHSLGGNSITLMVACLTPSDAYADENLSTLNYAGLTKNIANNVRINEDPKTALIRKLRKEIKMLRGLLARANQSFSIGGGGAGAAGGQQLVPASSYLSPTSRSRSQVASSSPQYPLQSQQSSMQSQPYPLPSDPHALSEKIIESVGIIKELLRDNNDLRSLYDSHASTIESLEFSNSTLASENNELRERIHFLESVIVEGSSEEVLKSPEEIVLAAEEDDEDDGNGGGNGGGNGNRNDMMFELDALREENQRLKGLMIASDFSNGGGGARSSRGPPPPPPPAQQYQQQPQRTHSASGHSQQQYVLNQYSAAPSRPEVYSSSSSSAARGSSNEGTSHPSTVYRANSQQLQTLTSLQGRKGRTSSGAKKAMPQQQQYSSAQEWERARGSELDRDRFGSESPLPSASASAARHMQAWDARPAGAHSFSNVAAASSAVRQSGSATTAGVGAPSSLLQAALAAPPISLQLGAQSGSSSYRAPPNPAIVAYMQQMQQQQNSSRGSSSGGFTQRSRY